MSAAGWAAKQSLVAQMADKTAEKAPLATGDVSTLTIAALGVAGATQPRQASSSTSTARSSGELDR